MVLVVLHGKVRAVNTLAFHGFNHRMVLMKLMNGRDERIRTFDPHTPSVVRYQAALRPDLKGRELTPINAHPQAKISA